MYNFELLSNILSGKGFLYFIITLCVILYLVMVVKEECIPINSIIYRDANVQRGVLSGINNHLVENVKELYIVKTGIYYSVLPSFGKNYFCHWSIFVKTYENNMFIISPTGHGSINVHEVLNEYIYNENGYTFIRGGSLGKHIVFNNQKYEPTFKFTVNDLLKDMLEVNKSIKYLAFSMNCQFVVSYVLSLYTKTKVPKISSVESFKRVVNDFLFGVKFNVNS